MNGPFDPRDPFGPEEVSAAARRAREQVRGEFEELRAELDLQAEGPDGEVPLVAGGFRRRARASVALLALTGAIAAAAANFALNGGRTPTGGNVLRPPSTEGPEAAVIGGDEGSAEGGFPILSLIPPSLQIGAPEALAGSPPPAPGAGPSPLFVVGKPVPVGGQRATGEHVGGADSVGSAPQPAPPPPTSEPHAPQELAFSPPPPAVEGEPQSGGHGGGHEGGPGDGGHGGGPGDGGHGGGSGGGVTSEGPEVGKGPGKGWGPGGKPGNGGGSTGAAEGGPGNGLGKGHLKGNGKGHGESSGKGHEKDPSSGGVVESGPGAGGEIPGDDSGAKENPGHGGKENPGHGSGGKGHDAGPPPPTAPPPPPAESGPPGHASDPGSNGAPGNSGNPGKGHDGSPGNSGK
jgi:hypothetical protein